MVLIPRKIWLGLLVFASVCALGLTAALIELDAYESFYAFSRSHEEWQLDELFLGFMATWMAFSVATLALTAIFGHRLMQSMRQKFALESQLEQLRKNQAMGHLLGGVAHAMKNHLVPIIALTDVVRAGLPEGSEEERNLSKVHLAATSASDLLLQVLMDARQEAGPVDYCEVCTTVGNAIALVSKLLPQHIVIRETGPPLTARLPLSGISLEIVLFNVFNNAIDALASKRGHILVAMERVARPLGAPGSPNNDNAWVRIRVVDNGRGMGPKDRQSMFDPSPGSAGQGMGSGLSETYGLITKAGGILDVVSNQGVGTAVSIYLPEIQID